MFEVRLNRNSGDHKTVSLRETAWEVFVARHLSTASALYGFEVAL
jgi:hypothetical protein